MSKTNRPAIVLMLSLLTAGCQTASLEDAAPRAVPAPAPALIDGQTVSEPAVDSADAATGETPAPSAVTVRRNPGITSLIPIEKTAPVEKKDFVAEGARRTGTYPSFGGQLKAANTQLTEAEKIAAEAEMTELLRNRATTPDARAQYEARLRELRALAASHAADTQQQIEN